ncbi:MAG: protein-glutamate O-methyltransferase CheR [Peptococcaceae bacterium]|nr:protein-glutamate O-methyltransferase CheR [Peptococcaceae bacterium]
MIKITDEEFKNLVDFVYRKYGINLSRKRQLIEGRLSHTIRERGLNSFKQYLDLLTKDNSGEEMHNFLNRITTNHSYFAREMEHFDFLLRQALPYLEKNRPRDLRIWSAGCSAGQEAYNIAMVLDQYFGARKSQWDTRILATDISMNVLSKGQAAIYPEDNLKDLPPQWKEKYFTRLTGGSYQVIERLRKEVIFKVFNLMDTFTHKKPFDIIFCRNVMIYFDSETTSRLINKFYQATSEGGYLFIGHSEVLDKEATQYQFIRPAIYQKNQRR